MDVEMYLNYKVLGSDYPLYYPSHEPHGIYDRVTVVIPDSWKPYRNEIGQLVVVVPDGTRCLDNEIATTPDGKAYFWGKDRGRYYVDVIDENTRRAENLKRLRTERGISQSELEKRAGLSPKVVSKLESGQCRFDNTTLKKVQSLAHALGVTVDELL